MERAKPNFPTMRVGVLFSLLSGAVPSLTSGDLRTAELPMLYQMFGLLAPNAILMGDRGFGNSVLLALCRLIGLSPRDRSGQTKSAATVIGPASGSEHRARNEG